MTTFLCGVLVGLLFGALLTAAAVTQTRGEAS